MKTVILDVRAPSAAMSDFMRVWKSGKPEASARISFATPELLWKVPTAKRWALLKSPCDAGPVSVREAARSVERDVKAVQGDVTALLKLGVLSRSESGEVEFPFQTVKPFFIFIAGKRKRASHKVRQ